MKKLTTGLTFLLVEYFAVNIGLSELDLNTYKEYVKSHDNKAPLTKQEYFTEQRKIWKNPLFQIGLPGLYYTFVKDYNAFIRSKNTN